jgi:hypothetical protein
LQRSEVRIEETLKVVSRELSDLEGQRAKLELHRQIVVHAEDEANTAALRRGLLTAAEIQAAAARMTSAQENLLKKKEIYSEGSDQVRMAQSELADAERNLKRQGSGVANNVRIEKTQAEFEAARAGLDQAAKAMRQQDESLKGQAGELSALAS